VLRLHGPLDLPRHCRREGHGECRAFSHGCYFVMLGIYYQSSAAPFLRPPFRLQLGKQLFDFVLLLKRSQPVFHAVPGNLRLGMAHRL